MDLFRFFIPTSARIPLRYIFELLDIKHIATEFASFPHFSGALRNSTHLTHINCIKKVIVLAVRVDGLISGDII